MSPPFASRVEGNVVAARILAGDLRLDLLPGTPLGSLQRRDAAEFDLVLSVVLWLAGVTREACRRTLLVPEAGEERRHVLDR